MRIVLPVPSGYVWIRPGAICTLESICSGQYSLIWFIQVVNLADVKMAFKIGKEL